MSDKGKLASTIEQLLDQNEIIQIVNDSSIQRDLLNYNKCLDCFLEKIDVHCEGVLENAKDVETNEFLPTLFMPGLDLRQHSITNHKVLFFDKEDGKNNKATCWAYLYAHHSLDKEIWDVYGIYEHELVKDKKNGKWKICSFVFRLSNVEGNADLPEMGKKKLSFDEWKKSWNEKKK